MFALEAVSVGVVLTPAGRKPSMEGPAEGLLSLRWYFCQSKMSMC